MAVPKCTDEEFIAIWHQHQSPTLVAKVLDTSLRSVQSRRVRIQDKLGLQLPTVDPRPTYNKVAIDANRAVVKLQVDDGIVIVGSDAHVWPGPLTTMQRAFIAFAKTFKPVAVIANGDMFDGARVSRFDHGSWADLSKKPDVKQELAAVQDFLGELEKASPKSRRLWPMGNHDARFEARLVNAAPEYAGVKGTRLKDHFPLWTPCWRVDINDDIIIRHRELGGEHADFRNVQTTGKTIVTGHDHRANVTAYTSYGGLHWGIRCGFMADGSDDPQFVDYLEGRAPNWCPAFVVLRFAKGRLLWPQLVTKHDDQTVDYCGQLIAV